ncbi:MAG: hypothetical protein IPJ40_19295 [Saprospirales bacterium]|nr:hypothetical protein [Saprospirales bacterium]
MRNLGIILLLLLPISWLSAQNLKPYILGFETTESVSDTKGKILANLESNGLKVVGQYKPASDANRWIIIFSSSELENAVKNVGGLSGFAAALRVGITREGGKTVVSYTNPVYWGNAYFRTDFDKVSAYYTTLTTHLENAMKASGSFVWNALRIEKRHHSQRLAGLPLYVWYALLRRYRKTRHLR